MINTTLNSIQKNPYQMTDRKKQVAFGFGIKGLEKLSACKGMTEAMATDIDRWSTSEKVKKMFPDMNVKILKGTQDATQNQIILNATKKNKPNIFVTLEAKFNETISQGKLEEIITTTADTLLNIEHKLQYMKLGKTSKK